MKLLYAPGKFPCRCKCKIAAHVSIDYEEFTRLRLRGHAAAGHEYRACCEHGVVFTVGGTY